MNRDRIIDSVVRLGVAGVMLAATGCRQAPESKPNRVTTIPLTGAPRYVPSEQLPIQSEGSHFIRYTGIPTFEHLQYLRAVCGDLSISAQGSFVVIATEVEDCVARVRARRP